MSQNIQDEWNDLDYVSDSSEDEKETEKEDDIPTKPYLVFGDFHVDDIRTQLPKELYEVEAFGDQNLEAIAREADWNLRCSLAQATFKACVLLFHVSTDIGQDTDAHRYLKTMFTIASEYVDTVYVCQPPGDPDLPSYRKLFDGSLIPTNILKASDHMWDGKTHHLSSHGANLVVTNLRYRVEF